MANTLVVAQYLNYLHKPKHTKDMDQMKMHKMMYFTQRESLMLHRSPLFDGEFEAWRYGPVLTQVRSEYLTGNMFAGYYGELEEAEKQLVTSVFERYDNYSAWDLSTLSHAEYSWQQARCGLAENEQGHEKLRLSAMNVDATREFLRRKGVVFS